MVAHLSEHESSMLISLTMKHDSVKDAAIQLDASFLFAQSELHQALIQRNIRTWVLVIYGGLGVFGWTVSREPRMPQAFFSP